MHRAARVRLEFAAQVVGVHPQVVGLLPIGRSPGSLEQILVRHEPAIVPGELIEQAPLRGREVDKLASGLAMPLIEVEHEVIAHKGRGRRPRLSTPPQCRPDPRHQFVHTEGLRDVIVRAFIERLHFVVALVPGGEHYDRYRSEEPDTTQHLDAIDIGQAQVEHDHVGPLVRNRAERVAPVGHRLDLETTGPQVDPQGSQDRWVIVHDQDPVGG